MTTLLPYPPEDPLVLEFSLCECLELVPLLLLIVRMIIDTLGYDVINVNTVVGSFVGAAVFTIAIILAGTISDFKESEKIPGKLASAIKNLYQDSRLIQLGDRLPVHQLPYHIRQLLTVINATFRRIPGMSGLILPRPWTSSMMISPSSPEKMSPPVPRKTPIRAVGRGSALQPD